MTVGIAGLGLIGGSFAKAISTNTSHRVLGFDLSAEVMEKAASDSVIHGVLDSTSIARCDVIIVALYPAASIEFVKEHAAQISPGAVVTDCSGTKRQICAALVPLSQKYGFHFIGGHPMAGLERSGFQNSTGALFVGASMILCPDEPTDPVALERISCLCLDCGFEKITISNPEMHDKIIAYTSQLAHIVSGAYIQSPTSEMHRGFSAGSFKDMTRVASLNEVMWAELMMENRDFLKIELDELIARLTRYSEALHTENREELIDMLREGKEKKHRSERIVHEKD